jgi:hypothetical protein
MREAGEVPTGWPTGSAGSDPLHHPAPSSNRVAATLSAMDGR